jgi:CRISPR-associated protein Csb1
MEEFGLVDLGKRSHPLPQDWWNVFKTIFKYDPNSLVHGILFPAMGIKIPRVLTAHLEALGAARVTSAGVKFDKLLMTTSGQPIFAVDEETAREIRATFIIDLALLRSFGRTENKNGTEIVYGLSELQKLFLLGLGLWKIGRLLRKPFRYRSRCDLELVSVRRVDVGAADPLKIQDFEIRINDLLNSAFQGDQRENRVTQVYWKPDEIFKKAKEKAATPDEAQAEEEEEGAGESGEE